MTLFAGIASLDDQGDVIFAPADSKTIFPTFTLQALVGNAVNGGRTTPAKLL
ncbi:hypothetical protein RU98_GL002452 [Enterococcus caccae]|nr:hypothetical protein RU98_GL002452 [Enterococcus caccae]